MIFKFQLRLPEELHKRLTTIAAKERRSIHSQILLFLEKEADQYEKNNTETKPE